MVAPESQATQDKRGRDAGEARQQAMLKVAEIAGELERLQLKNEMSLMCQLHKSVEAVTANSHQARTHQNQGVSCKQKHIERCFRRRNIRLSSSEVGTAFTLQSKHSSISQNVKTLPPGPSRSWRGADCLNVNEKEKKLA